MQILIQGRASLNRVIDGDTVAVEILPKSKWSCPSDIVLEDDETKEITLEDLNNEEQIISQGQRNKDIIPTGRIVGIIKRKWRQYCGILQQRANDGSVYQIFVPAEKKIPKIRIETRQAEILRTQKIIVAIDWWPRHSRYPHVSQIYTMTFLFSII